MLGNNQSLQVVNKLSNSNLKAHSHVGDIIRFNSLRQSTKERSGNQQLPYETLECFYEQMIKG
jgi:hypothetical protein